MPFPEPLLARLNAIQNLSIRKNAPLSEYTRFGVGGSAAVLLDAHTTAASVAAVRVLRDSALPFEVIAGGSNLIVADTGYDGAILRLRASQIHIEDQRLHADAGVVLQHLVDTSIAHGLENLHTMTGIPGSVGAAVYGNAGAYGHSISESVVAVQFFDGKALREFGNAGCQFHYRESIFKQRKDWLILSATLQLPRGDAGKLKEIADGILRTRNEKYPPTMKCAGSIFKNLLFRELPESARAAVPEKVVREGKVPSAWFLEQVGAKGIRNGGIHVADYHANLIYNAGGGTAQQVCEVIDDLKARVQDKFAFAIEEEVQYIGFNGKRLKQ